MVTIGETVSVAEAEVQEPLHDPICQQYPLLPPTALNVVLEPSQILLVPEMEVEAVGMAVTMTVAEPSVPQQPLPLLDLK